VLGFSPETARNYMSRANTQRVVFIERGKTEICFRFAGQKRKYLRIWEGQKTI
jgi:hypothetical protein